MDYIESLAKQASQITMYDVKTYYNQAKNMVLNLSEMEAKVREATNDDPWGASSTLMQEIADGTNNFAQFNEIMPTIYSRFMEKEAREWRQIYKALTLLEFLVKNGSERVVDDARAHVSTIKMLRSFHYIDEKGKDQGINVRNRASEIALLLSDVDKIRVERRKAKANKSKYQGVGNDGARGFVTSGGSRYGGFGSDSLGGAGGGASGSRYGGSGSGYDGDDYRSSRSSRAAAPEYDEYEGADDFEDDGQPPRRAPSASSSRRPNPPPKSEPKKEPVVEKPKEVNLFDFDDDEPISTPAAPAALSAAAPSTSAGDDDFDDFQSATSAPVPAPVAAAQPAQPKTAAQNSNNNNNLFDLLNASTPSVPAPAPQAAARPQTVGQFASPPSYSSYSPAPSTQTSQPAVTSRPSYTSTASNAAPTPSALSPKPTGGSSTFDDLWTTSLSSLGPNTAAAAAGKASAPKKSINDLEREKAMNKLWGPSPSAAPAQPQQSQQNQFGQGFSGAPAKPSGGGDDLLL